MTVNALLSGKMRAPASSFSDAATCYKPFTTDLNIEL